MAAPDPAYRRLRARWQALHPWDLAAARGLSALARALRAAGHPARDALFFDQVACVAAPAVDATATSAVVLPTAFLRLGFTLLRGDGSVPLCPPPDPNSRARDALPDLARWQLARLASLLSDAASDRAPEDLHQFRIALRRARAVLRLLDATTPEVARSLSLTEALVETSGRVRDLDISLTLVDRLDASAPSRHAARVQLAALRVDALTALQSLVQAPEVHAELLQLVRPWGARETPRGDTATAAERAWKSARRRLRVALRCDLNEPEALHAVRRRARRLRDVIEVFGHALTARRRRWRAALAPAHSLLGDLQDLDTLLSLLAPEETAWTRVRTAAAQARVHRMASLAAPLVALTGRVG